MALHTKPIEFRAYQPRTLLPSRRQRSVFEDDDLGSPPLPVQPTVEAQFNTERPRGSQVSSQQRIESCDPQGSQAKMTPLTKDEVLVLFQLCNRNAEAFQPGKKTAFWSYIQAYFERETGKDHKSLYRVVQREIDKRRKYLDGLGTAQTDSKSELTVQTDNWIGVVTGEKRIETQ
ncbi:hypothetical protein GMDG_06805 [Pseudogymnoascus destructans 20631-21]|uniref:Uncharacterized protein n=1 Tax=Pseudogymnoascus destructans (strain ATCC MYA-4855 / 20631-21) TaxID=658429 RepID=L8FVK2_PSED2|nr:hypothetical protein GMDG_06805 [Pseudogymnoascus destructans 20631-21]